MIRLSWLLLVLRVLLPVEIYADSIPPVPTGRDLSVDQAMDLFGPPELVLGNILAYRSDYAGLPADVSLFRREDFVEEIILAFPGEPPALRREADRVLKRLRVEYGPPSAVIKDSGFRTHRWEDSRGEMIHTVVYTPGREQHFIRTTVRR